MRYLTALCCLLLLAGCGIRAEMAKQAEKIKQDRQAKKAADEKEAAAKPPDDGKGIIGKMTNEVVDMKKALAENPDLVEVDQRITGTDPITVYGQAYINTRSKASQLGMIHAINLFKAEHERHPTYDEFMKIMREHHVEFTMLPYYQMYAYDDTDGRIVVLQDPEKRKKKEDSE